MTLDAGAPLGMGGSLFSLLKSSGNAGVDKRSAAGEGLFLADPHRLEQVLCNFISNAVSRGIV